MKNTILLLIVFLAVIKVDAQKYKFEKVTIAALKNNVYEKDTSANAVILNSYRSTYFEHDHPDGWILVTEIHQRIKILNKDGLDYATKKIPLYKSGKREEKAINIKGFVFNEENGKVITEKLKKKSIFKEEKSKYWNQTSITMPNINVGTILQWSYKIKSPFWKIDDLIIQEDIPTKNFYAKIETLSYFDFNEIVKGIYTVRPKQFEETRNVKVNYEQSTNTGLTQSTRFATIKVNTYVSEYELNDIPALKEELYVNNIDNYRAKVFYELRSVKFPNSGLKQLSTTWEKVVKTINEHKNFGKQLKKTSFLEDEGVKIKRVNDNYGKISKAFDVIKSKMTWNGDYGKYTKKNLQKAYNEGTGNVSEINLMLVALLRESGLKSYPVLVSTRKHGVPVFPTLEGFNYVVASCEIGGEIVLLDATDKDLPVGLLPPRALNWEGTMVLDNGQFKKVNLFPTKHSQFNAMMNITINEDGSIQGKRSTSVNNLDAYLYRKTYKNRTQEELEETVMNDNDYDDLSDLEMKNLKDLTKSVGQVYSFELDDGAEVVGDEIYFSPLFSLTLDTNPFVLEERLFPVDFTYPRSRKRIVNIKLPAGYKVVSLPKPMKMNLPDGLGAFLFNISETPNGINVMSTFKINSAIIPAYKYQELKEFYKQRVKKETEKVVLKKI
ncbi:MAG: DUF3857 domain-containing protein [Flavobacteriaceae bacterium]|nr:DUF3857 domain-containing protein [Flavobacteriaceae bacterium]